jgi:hypothetical protein
LATIQAARRSGSRSITPQAASLAVSMYRGGGGTLSEITRELKRRRFRTATGSTTWSNRTLVRLLQRAGVYVSRRDQMGPVFSEEAKDFMRAAAARGVDPSTLTTDLNAAGITPLRGDAFDVRQVAPWLNKDRFSDSTDPSAAVRFDALVRRRGDCHEWRGTISHDGGGLFNVGGGRQVLAHRYAWELAHGQLGDTQLRSTCPLGNRACVNVAHWRLLGSVEEEFWRNTERDPTTGCLLYTGDRDAGGYGRIMINGKSQLAHRFAYERKRPIPEGHQLHHIGRCNHACIEFTHLLPVADTSEHAAVDREERQIIAAIEDGSFAEETAALPVIGYDPWVGAPRLGALRPDEVPA